MTEQHFEMERAPETSAFQHECGAHDGVGKKNTYLGNILRSTLNGSRKIMLLGTNVRIALYLSGLLFLPLVGGFLPSLECCSFCSTLSESFNSYFVEMAWEWTLLLVVPFMLLESYILSGGDIKKPLQCQLPRVCVTTCSWLVWLKIFKIIEQGSLRGCPVMGLFMKCHCRRRCCRVSSGLRISGHTFILIQSSLMLVEEARALLDFEAVKVQLHQELHNRLDGDYLASNLLRDFDDVQLEKLRNLYRFLGPVVHVLFLCMGLLQLFWDAMLFSSMLYYHSMIEKILGGVTAMIMWALIYRFWYKTCTLDELLDGQAYPIQPDIINSTVRFDRFPSTFKEMEPTVTDTSVENYYIPNCDGSTAIAYESQRIFGSFFPLEPIHETITEPFTEESFKSTSKSARQRTRRASNDYSASIRNVFRINPYYAANAKAVAFSGPRISFCRAASIYSLKAGADSNHPKKTPSLDLSPTNSASEDTFLSLNSSYEFDGVKEQDDDSIEEENSGTELCELAEEESNSSVNDANNTPRVTFFEETDLNSDDSQCTNATKPKTPPPKPPRTFATPLVNDSEPALVARDSYIEHYQKSKVPPPKPPRLNPPGKTELIAENVFRDDNQKSKVPPPKPPRLNPPGKTALIAEDGSRDDYQKSKVPPPKPPRLNPPGKTALIAKDDSRDDYQKSNVAPPKPPRTYATNAIKDSDPELVTMDSYREYYQRSNIPPPKPPRLHRAEIDDDYYQKSEDSTQRYSSQKDGSPTEPEQTCKCFSWCGKCQGSTI